MLEPQRPVHCFASRRDVLGATWVAGATRLLPFGSLLLGACGTASDLSTRRAPSDLSTAVLTPQALYVGVNRLSWGATTESLKKAARLGFTPYVENQLNARPQAALPQVIQAQIDALSISQTPLLALAQDAEKLRREGETAATETERDAARQAYQRELTRLAREAAARHLVRAVYSEQQLLEHMTWFWFNHFNVHQFKRDVRAMVGDYEENAIRPHALGRFRDMLGAVARHPAMLRYLDNDQNAVGRINENYARELLELHTMGVNGGYTQADVQELARVLTGFGVRLDDAPLRLRKEWAGLQVRQGAFEFNPNRHDFGDKRLLGRTITGRGAAELDEVLDLLVAHPSTARFVSRKMAVFFLGETVPPALVERMAQRFLQSGGHIADTLAVLLFAPEFVRSSPGVFKDPMHYTVSALRLAYADQPAQLQTPIRQTQPVQNILNRLGQGLYNKQTPDGYPPDAAAWSGSGQLAVRFEVARQLAGAQPQLFRMDDAAANPNNTMGAMMTATAAPAPAAAAPTPAVVQPQLPAAMPGLTLSAATQSALDQAGSPFLSRALFFSSPEFMYR